MSRPFIISGTGCALIDYLYSPVSFSNGAFSQFLSLKPGDGGLAPGKLVFTEEFEKFSGKDYLQSRNLITDSKQPVALNIGGPSIVSLIHAAQLLGKTNAEIYFFGSKGTDEAGRFMDEKLRHTPLKIGKYKNSAQFTPFTDVLSDPDWNNGQGERIFINNIGAAWDFLPTDLDEHFFKSDMVVFGGTALVPNIHCAIDELLAKAKSHQAITVVNTVYDFLNEKKNPSIAWPLGKSINSYQNIDLLICDMEEALSLAGTNSVGEAIDFFQTSGVGAAVITHGANPVHFFAQNQLFGNIPVSQVPVSERVICELSNPENRTGDTTGCGDNFVGGMIASIATQLIHSNSHSANLKLAVALGVVSGGFACFYNGGTFYEKQAGEKAAKIESYLHDYLNQIDNV